MADKRRILITGSGGRLGRLLHSGRNLVSESDTEILFQSRQAGRDIRWAPGEDLSVFPACDAVIALWGATSGTEAELALNASLVRLTRQVARHCGANRVFHLSSAAVYGPSKRITEDTPLQPVNAYGRAKRDMERVIRAEQWNIAETSVRLANVVGADSLAPALEGPDAVHLDRFADGRGPRRSYIGAVDLLRVFLGLSRIRRERLPQTLNVAAPKPIAMQDFAAAAHKPIVWQTAPDTAVQEVSMEVSRLHTLLPEICPVFDARALVDEMRRLEVPA